MTPEFLLTTLVVCLTPGTGVLMTVAAGLAHGTRVGLVTALGCTLAVVPHMTAAVVGAAAVFATNDLAFAVLKWAGVLYLLWLAWSALRERGALRLAADETAAAPAGSVRSIVGRAVLANALNPKLSVFFFAFLPQFVDDDRAVAGQMLGLGLLFVAATGATMVGYALAATSVRRHVVGRPRVMTWFRRVVAVSFVGLGVRLAMAQR